MGFDKMRFTRQVRLSFTLPAFLVLMLFVAASACAQTGQVFRLDGGNSTYAFGVNERGELQTLYWGGRLGRRKSMPGGAQGCSPSPR
jgi:hypothetical protein